MWSEKNSNIFIKHFCHHPSSRAVSHFPVIRKLLCNFCYSFAWIYIRASGWAVRILVFITLLIPCNLYNRQKWLFDIHKILLLSVSRLPFLSLTVFKFMCLYNQVHGYVSRTDVRTKTHYEGGYQFHWKGGRVQIIGKDVNKSKFYSERN